MRTKLQKSIPLFLIALALSWCANAQTTDATVVGDVADQQGGAVPGAKVSLKDLATGVTREVQTTDAGSFRVFPVRPGSYEATVTATGFKTAVQGPINVDAAANVKLDFR